ncbi:MAG: ATP-binding protein, partial [Rhodoglobus sp.]|nr:ATP-binding protein [Rhodoglobus sp.]
MYSELNPYAAGSGLKPPELAGRQDEIDAFDLLIARARKRNPSREIMLHGLRGVGKTVLLKRFVA